MCRIFSRLWSATANLAKNICALCGAIAAGTLLLFVWALLTVRLRLSLFVLSRKRTIQTEPERSRAMRPVQITFMEVPYAENILAIVRFTGYDDNGSVLIVRQVEYSDDQEGLIEMEEAVERAVDNEIDLTVLSCYSPDYFPNICRYIDTEV